MAVITEHLEDCPKCSGDDLRIFYSSRCLAHIVICNKCEHEAQRENERYDAICTWNREALALASPDTQGASDDD